MHPAAEGFILRMPTAAEAVMLARGATSACHLVVVCICQGNAPCYAIGSIFGNLDGGLSFLIHLAAGLDSAERITECPRRAGTHGTDDLIHSRAISGDE